MKVNLSKEIKKLKDEKGTGRYRNKEITSTIGKIEIKGMFYSIGCYLDGTKISKTNLQKLIDGEVN